MGSSKSESDHAIDAVITWVDGSDPAHRKKRLLALNEDPHAGSPALSSRADETRFLDNGELRYCMASIRTFAPWIRRIFLVTDNQHPGFLTKEVCEKHKITIVDHTEIFDGYDWALPTFNTRTIETALWRIPGLSDKFIYFNDDFVITAPVRVEDFFQGESIVLRGAWRPVVLYGSLRLCLNRMFSFFAKKVFGITRTMHLLLQIRSAELAGFNRRYFRIEHVPHPVHKPILKKFFEEKPEHFEDNIRYKFRNIDQFSAIFLAYHLKIARHEAVFMPDEEVMMIHGEMDLSLWLGRKIKKIKQQKVRFLSLQGIEKMNRRHRMHLDNVLTEITQISF